MAKLLDCFQAMQRDCQTLHPSDVRLLQDQHNVNVHASADECDSYLDSDDMDTEFGGREDITVISGEEFIERYV